MKEIVDPYSYNITVRKGVFEGETLFEARVKELPDVREYAESAQDAYALAIDTIETAAAMFAEVGRSFPPPVSPQDDFSGRVTLRLPKGLHRALAGAAEDEGVSLNQHLVAVLAAPVRAPATRRSEREYTSYSVARTREVTGLEHVVKSPITSGNGSVWSIAPPQCVAA